MVFCVIHQSKSKPFKENGWRADNQAIIHFKCSFFCGSPHFLVSVYLCHLLYVEPSVKRELRIHFWSIDKGDNPWLQGNDSATRPRTFWVVVPRTTVQQSGAWPRNNAWLSWSNTLILVSQLLITRIFYGNLPMWKVVWWSISAWNQASVMIFKSSPSATSTCGDHTPDRKINHYDTSAHHIYQSVNNSLERRCNAELDVLIHHAQTYLLGCRWSSRSVRYLNYIR